MALGGEVLGWGGGEGGPEENGSHGRWRDDGSPWRDKRSRQVLSVLGGKVECPVLLRLDASE